MLRSLTVKDFAIIDQQALDFTAGLNVFTGETGAGKSILIEALGFLLGGRGSSAWLRTGADRLVVTGDFELEEGAVRLRRELDASGKTRAFLDDKPMTVSALAALGERLVDFHGQHEHQALLRPAVQQDCLDRYGELEALLAKTQEAFAAWSAAKAGLDAAQMSDEERRRRLEYGRFQLGEIDDAKLKPAEDWELEAALPLLKNAERLRGLAAAVYQLLYEDEAAVMGGLLKAERSLAELSRIDPAMRDTRDALEAARLALEDVTRTVGGYRDGADSDPKRLDALLSRQDVLGRLKKKYGGSVSDVLAFREKLSAELDLLDNTQRRQEELEAGLAESLAALDEACGKLHRARMKAARGLEAGLLKELKTLGMAQARFSVAVELEEGRYSRTGGDAVEFLIAPNPGEPLKPVRSVASGGELSRVMLALKTVLAKADRVPILVFDEVDAGIGGVVARAVGEKLSALGRSRQVLCVTHLPQVACFARRHLLVSKQSSGGRTAVRVEALEGARRLEAVALMLGGRQATAASRRHAEELLASSRTKENSLA
ncbi:MAG: DNA repair protein RecN [Elusimicrobiota bacterium]